VKYITEDITATSSLPPSPRSVVPLEHTSRSVLPILHRVGIFISSISVSSFTGSRHYAKAEEATISVLSYVVWPSYINFFIPAALLRQVGWIFEPDTIYRLSIDYRKR